jgi:hypothetical protein
MPDYNFTDDEPPEAEADRNHASESETSADEPAEDDAARFAGPSQRFPHQRPGGRRAGVEPPIGD